MVINMSKVYLIKENVKLPNPFYNKRDSNGNLIVSNPILDMSDEEFMEKANAMPEWKREAFIEHRQKLQDMIQI